MARSHSPKTSTKLAVLALLALVVAGPAAAQTFSQANAAATASATTTFNNGGTGGGGGFQFWQPTPLDFGEQRTVTREAVC